MNTNSFPKVLYPSNKKGIFKITINKLVLIPVNCPSIIDIPFIPPSSIRFGINIAPIENAASAHPITIKTIEKAFFIITFFFIKLLLLIFKLSHIS